MRDLSNPHDVLARRRWLLRAAVVGIVALLGGLVVLLGAAGHGAGWW